MTTEFYAALIIAAPPTLTAVGAFVMAMRVARRADRKLDHITVLTNSTLTAANKRIDELEHIINTMSARLGETVEETQK